MTWRKFWRRPLAPVPWLAALAFVWWEAHVHHETPLAMLRSPAGWPVLLWLGLTLAGQAAQSLKTPIEVAAKADPVGLLRADRRAYLAARITVAAISAVTVWLWAGGVFAIADGTGYALDLAVVLLLGGTATAWVCYVDARLRLAALRRLPWRTTSFLDDAHRRGVLRQTGAVYQFRHIRLQQQLAAGYSPWPRPVVPVAAWTDRQLARLRPFFPLLVAEPVSGAPGADADVTEYTATVEGNGRRSAQAAVLLLQVLVMLAMFFIAVFVLPGWIAVLIVIVDVLLIPTVILAVDKLKASAYLPVDRGSVHVTPGSVEVTQGPHPIRLTPDDVQRIAVRRLGNSWFCYAVQAKLRPSAVRSGQGSRDWFPLFWTPRYTARVPRGLVSALARFAGDRLDHRLDDWQSRQAVVDYEASGTVEVKSISGTVGSYLILLSVALTLTVISLLVGWTILGVLAVLAIIASLVLIVICGHQLTLRAARKRLPSGRWSFRVRADAIEVTRAGAMIRLSRGDIESVEFRSIRGSSSHKAIYARLRPGAAGRLHVMDGWYPLYWTSDFSRTVPPGLLVALGVFASGRLVGSLKRKSARALARAPVYRGS